jgi:hypothetical protein
MFGFSLVVLHSAIPSLDSLPWEAQNANFRSSEIVSQRIANQFHNIGVVRFSKVAHRIEWAEVLDVQVSHAVFVHKRCRRGLHQLVVLRSQNGVRDSLLSDGAVNQLCNSTTVR